MRGAGVFLLFCLAAQAGFGGVALAYGGRQAADEAAALQRRSQQLDAREAALNAKEASLRRLSASLDAKIKELNSAKQALEGALQNRKTADGQRFQKMVKIYKGLKPQEAGKLLDKLDEQLEIQMLNQMDQRTLASLIPYLSQPRVLKWTTQTLLAK